MSSRSFANSAQTAAGTRRLNPRQPTGDPRQGGRGSRRSPINPRQASVNARDAGLELIRRFNRWLIAGAVAATGVISLIASQSFHGRTLKSSAASTGSSSQSSSSQSSSSSGGSTSSGSGTAIQAPVQSPSVSSSGSAAVVSGGS